MERLGLCLDDLDEEMVDSLKDAGNLGGFNVDTLLIQLAFMGVDYSLIVSSGRIQVTKKGQGCD